MSISAAVLSSEIKQGSKIEYLVTLPISDGHVYLVPSVPNALLLTPKKYIKAKKLQPLFTVAWNVDLNEGLGGIVVAHADDNEFNNLSNSEQATRVKLLNKANTLYRGKIKNVRDFFNFYSPEGRALVVKEVLMSGFGLSEKEADMHTSSFIEQMHQAKRTNLVNMFNPEETTVELKKLTPAK